MELHLNIVGAMMVALALIHVIFPRYFQWKQALASLCLLDRQLMYVHTFFVAFMVLLMGVLCLSSGHDLVHTPLGHRVAAGMFLFWAVRLYFQFFVYSPLHWRGKTFETVVHIFFSFIWLYFSFVFGAVAFGT